MKMNSSAVLIRKMEEKELAKLLVFSKNKNCTVPCFSLKDATVLLRKNYRT